MKLSDIIQKNQTNNFNSIRLAMALGVLYNHSFVLFHDYGKQDITTKAFDYFDAGSLSVSVFFMISGLLLTQSFYQTSSPLKFVLKRMLRIFPGLFVSLLFVILVVGAFATHLPLREYFVSKDTYRLIYDVMLNNEVFIFDSPTCFTHNVTPYVVNGSLWTLPFELLCYIGLFVSLSAWVFVQNPNLNAAKKGLLLALGVYFLVYLFGLGNLTNRILGLCTGFTGRFLGQNAPLRLYVFFATGSLLYVFRHKVVLNVWVMVALMAALAVGIAVHLQGLPRLALEYLNIVYVVLCYAGWKKAQKLNASLDPSYGVYLYAWPIQQCISMTFPTMGAYESMALTIPLTLLMGVVSFKWIEKPAMNWVNPLMKKIA